MLANINQDSSCLRGRPAACPSFIFKNASDSPEWLDSKPPFPVQVCLDSGSFTCRHLGGVIPNIALGLRKPTCGVYLVFIFDIS
jgi:hypothetical protein